MTVLPIDTNYRPYPKDGGSTVFTGICLSTPGEGTLARVGTPPTRLGTPPRQGR